MTSCNLKIVFSLLVLLKSFLTFKYKLTKMSFSGLVSKYECGGCNANRYGERKRCFKVRIYEDKRGFTSY